MIKPYLNLKSIRLHGAEIEQFSKITKNIKEKIKLRHSDLDLQERSISPKLTESLSNVEH